ncbi:hypothetical protein Dimus_026892, partial [Dionaea muscipula]
TQLKSSSRRHRKKRKQKSLQFHQKNENGRGFNIVTTPPIQSNTSRGSITPGSHLQPGNSHGQSLSGVEVLQMISRPYGSRIWGNGTMAYGQQQISPVQSRQQSAQQNPLTSPQVYSVFEGVDIFLVFYDGIS